MTPSIITPAASKLTLTLAPPSFPSLSSNTPTEQVAEIKLAWTLHGSSSLHTALRRFLHHVCVCVCVYKHDYYTYSWYCIAENVGGELNLAIAK